MIDVLVWNKCTRVVMQLAERLNISPEKALHLFYNSKVYALLLNKQYPLITLSDAYITDELLILLVPRVYTFIYTVNFPIPSFWIIPSAMKEFNSSIATFLFRPVRWL